MSIRGIMNIGDPGDTGRIETGAIRFGDDWPGLFIRGDNCMGLFDNLNAAFRVAHENPVAALDIIQKILDEYMKIMEDDVFTFETPGQRVGRIFDNSSLIKELYYDQYK